MVLYVCPYCGLRMDDEGARWGMSLHLEAAHWDTIIDTIMANAKVG